MVGEFDSRSSSSGSFKRCPGQYAVFLGEHFTFNYTSLQYVLAKDKSSSSLSFEWYTYTRVNVFRKAIFTAMCVKDHRQICTKFH